MYIGQLLQLRRNIVNNETYKRIQLAGEHLRKRNAILSSILPRNKVKHINKCVSPKMTHEAQRAPKYKQQDSDSDNLEGSPLNSVWSESILMSTHVREIALEFRKLNMVRRSRLGKRGIYRPVSVVYLGQSS